MARQFQGMLAALVMVALAGLPGLSAQSEEKQTEQPPQQAQQTTRRDGHDRRPWWKNPKDIAEIGLSSEQSATIDAIFHTEIEKMKPLRDEINRLERVLDGTMRANLASVEVVEKQAEKIERHRAELNRMRTVMLYRIRRVLNPDQNAKLQAMWDRQEAARRKQDGDRRR